MDHENKTHTATTTRQIQISPNGWMDSFFFGACRLWCVASSWIVCAAMHSEKPHTKRWLWNVVFTAALSLLPASPLYILVCVVCVCAIWTRRRNALNFIVFKAYCLVWHAFTLLFGIVAGLCAKGHHIQFSQSHRIDREPCGSTIVAKQHSQTIQMAPDRLTHTGTKWIKKHSVAHNWLKQTKTHYNSFRLDETHIFCVFSIGFFSGGSNILVSGLVCRLRRYLGSHIFSGQIEIQIVYIYIGYLYARSRTVQTYNANTNASYM